MKTIENIAIGDIERHPVWRFVNKPNGSGTEIQPVKQLPCTSLAGKIVGIKVILADGSQAWALLGGIDTTNARLTEHFLTTSIEHEGHWFHFARYHDYNYDERGPYALAAFLGKNADQVFPIHYDLRSLASGDPAALAGQILKEPRERLTREEIVALAVP